MSDLFTDDDVTAALDVLWSAKPPGGDTIRDDVRDMLAAVAPAIAARALRQAAGDLVGQVWECEPHELGAKVVAWLRARADALEADQ